MDCLESVMDYGINYIYNQGGLFIFYYVYVFHMFYIRR